MSRMNGKHTHTHTHYRIYIDAFTALLQQSVNNPSRTKGELLSYKEFGRGDLSAPPSSVVGNALVVIDDGIASVNVKNRYQGARVSARGQTVNLKMVFGGNLYMVV